MPQRSIGMWKVGKENRILDTRILGEKMAGVTF